MSVKDVIRLLEQVANRPRDKATLAALDAFLPTAGAKDCGRVIRKAKDLIKSRKVQAEGKLQTLKLVCRCMDSGNTHFVTCLIHRFLRRLIQFASHRKVHHM
jgi:hypothetical protein